MRAPTRRERGFRFVVILLVVAVLASLAFLPYKFVTDRYDIEISTVPAF